MHVAWWYTFFMNENGYDFVAIGDITTDAFILLKDAEVHCSIDNENCELCVRFGDKIPYERVDVIRAVGNSPNAAASAARLGLGSALVCNIGDDQNGKECIDTLKGNGVSEEYVKIEAGKETNYHYVLRFGAERTILVLHHEYDYALPDFASAPKYMYLSSLGEHSLPFHLAIAAYAKAHPETKLVFQPGTFQLSLGKEKLADIYASSELCFVNREEAMRILGTDKNDIKPLLTGIHALGPKIVGITDGPAGAYVSDGTEMLFMPIYPDPAPPISRTGAGDAFASTFTSALALGKTVREAIMWAPINSMNVVQHVGAQTGLLTREALEKYLADAPASYHFDVL
jgi:ribokinase